MSQDDNQKKLRQQFTKHDKDNDGKLTIQQSAKVLHIILKKHYYHGLISNKMRVFHQGIQQPILVSVQDLQRIYKAFATVNPFEKHIIQVKQMMNSFLEDQKDAMDQLDLIPKDRGQTNKVKVLVGEQKQKYSNQINLKIQKYDKDYFKQPPQTSVLISLKTQHLQELRTKLQALINMGKNLLVQSNPQMKQLAECLLTDVIINKQKNCVQVTIKLSNEQLRDLQQRLNNFLEQFFKYSVQFKLQIDFEFQKSLYEFFRSQLKTKPTLQYFIAKDSRFKLQLQTNQIVSSLKQMAKQIGLFDDFQYDRYHGLSSIILFLLSCQNGSAQFQFQNSLIKQQDFIKQEEEEENHKQLSSFQNQFPQFSNQAILQIQQQIKQMYIQVTSLLQNQMGQLQVLDLINKIDEQIKIRIQIACFKVQLNLRIKDLCKLAQNVNQICNDDSD